MGQCPKSGANTFPQTWQVLALIGFRLPQSAHDFRARAPGGTRARTDALRQGAIVRGMELDEAQVVAGEKIAPMVRAKLLASGDETLVSIVKALPEESWGRLKEIFAEADSQ